MPLKHFDNLFLSSDLESKSRVENVGPLRTKTHVHPDAEKATEIETDMTFI